MPKPIVLAAMGLMIASPALAQPADMPPPALVTPDAAPTGNQADAAAAVPDPGTAPAPRGPVLLGTVVPAPPGFFTGMNVTNKIGDLFGRVLSADDNRVVVQTIDGYRHAVPVAKLSIENATAVTDMTERQLRNLPGSG